MNKNYSKLKKKKVYNQLLRYNSLPNLSLPEQQTQVEVEKEIMDKRVREMTLEELMMDFWSMLDEIKIVTRPDIQILVNEINEMKMDYLRLIGEMKKLQKQIEAQGRRIDVLENISKKKNLIFKGIPATNKNEHKIVEELCVNVLQVKNIKVETVKKYESKSRDGEVLVASFTSDKKVNDILKNTRKLKGMNISVGRDLAFGTRQERDKLLQVRKEILRINENINVVVKDDVMYCEKRKFFWKKGKGLINSDGVCALDFFNMLLGVDMSLFLSTL